MKIGAQDVLAMYIGSQPVQRVYLGSQLLWTASSSAEITSITGTTSGIFVEHTGILAITGRTDGIFLEAS